MRTRITGRAYRLTSMRRNPILGATMYKRSLILLLALFLLGLPLASVPAKAAGCCGSAPERHGAAGGPGQTGGDPDNLHKKCCCGDPKTCTCHLSEDDASPSPEATPVSTNTDTRPGVMGVHAAPSESILPHRSPAIPLVRFTFARAPSSDIYILNHNFLC